MDDLDQYPHHYRTYNWEKKHCLYGYPGDSYPDFCWIKNLESRFRWLRDNVRTQDSSSHYLIMEMIEWGGSQNGILQKFNDGMGEHNIKQLTQDVVLKLDDPKSAIEAALKFPGFGLTYASKMLRFLEPARYGALDSRIRKKLFEVGGLRKIHDGQASSMVDGYLEFLALIDEITQRLGESDIKKPSCGLSTEGEWRPSDVEMALFGWSSI